MDDRLPDTAFTQYGGHLKANWAITPTTQLMASYLRGQQDGGKRYDQLLGGDGNLVGRPPQPDGRPLLREAREVGGRASSTASPSPTPSRAQREERVNQGGNGNPAGHHHPRAGAHDAPTALQAGLAEDRRPARPHPGRRCLLRDDRRPPPSARTRRRAPPPCGAVACPTGRRYRHGGVFLQDVFEAVPGTLRLNGAVRFSAASYEAKAVGQPHRQRGARSGPTIRYDTERLHLPRGGPLDGDQGLERGRQREPRLPRPRHHRPRHLRPHRLRLRGVEPGGGGPGRDRGHHRRRHRRSARATRCASSTRRRASATSSPCATRRARFKADLTAFQTDIDDNVAKQSLILPPGAVGPSLAGEPITRQLPTGVVFVAVSANPVLVRANFDDARIKGIEATFDAELSPVRSPRRDLHLPPRGGPHAPACRRTSKGARRPPMAG